MMGRPVKLDDHQIAQIRERRAAGEKLYSLAVSFNVHETTIRRVCQNVIKKIEIVGAVGLTPWMRERIASPSHRWSHMRSYRSRDYAHGAASVFATQYPHLDWTVTHTAVWMRLPIGRVIAAQEVS